MTEELRDVDVEDVDWRQFVDEWFGDELEERAEDTDWEEESGGLGVYCRLELNLDDVYESEYFEDVAHAYLTAPDEVEDRIKDAAEKMSFSIDGQLCMFDSVLLSVEFGEFARTIASPPSEIRSARIGSMVAVVGKIVSESESVKEYGLAAFECGECGGGNGEVLPFRDEWSEPDECDMCESNGPFELLPEESTFENRTYLRVRDRLVDVDRDPGEIDCVVRQFQSDDDELLDDVEQGRDVVVIGQYRERDRHEKRSQTIVDVDEIKPVDGRDDAISVTDEDEEIIREIAGRDDHLDVVSDALAPDIVGRATPKQLAWLQQLNPEWQNGKRGNIHVLMVGDASTGKSDIQDAVREIAPKTAATSGDQASAAGLIAAAVQDDLAGSEQWTFKSGVLPRADGGTAVLDELDKLDSEPDSLHKALSAGEVNPSKAGQSTTLRTRTNVLAAANPVSGDFRDFDEIWEQIEMPGPLLSRCIIVPMEDEVDGDHDEVVAEAVLDAHDGDISSSSIVDSHIEQCSDCEHPHDVLRKYVEIADKASAKLSNSAKTVLKESYREMRQEIDSEAPGPDVKTRHLEDMVRLSKALSKSRGADAVLESDDTDDVEVTVSAEDAAQAVDLLTSALSDVFGANIVTSGKETVLTEDHRTEVVTTISEHEPVTYREISEYADVSDGVLNTIISKMENNGRVVKTPDGEYELA